MRWWVWIYLVVFLFFAVSNVVQEAMKKDHRRLWLLLIPFTACVAATLAYGYVAPSTAAAALIAALLAAGLPVIVWDGLDDLREFRSGKPDTGDAVGVFFIVLVEALFGTGYVLGIMFVARSWS